MDDWTNGRLFPLPDVPPPPKGVRRIELPQERMWTESEAQLVAGYLFGFIQVTKDGTYIDAFAGPQDPQHLEAWAARLVLDLKPAWALKHFYLFEISPPSVMLLQELAEAHAGRDVQIRQGDVNARIHEVLNVRAIPPKEPTFVLLDQRTFECDWATVDTLARFRPEGYKLELFYFLADSWLNRAAGGAKTPGRARMRAWWGRDDVEWFIGLRGAERAHVMASRFVEELGYAYANPYPIHERRGRGGRRMYYMIHASDHYRAVSLMDAAYRDAALPPGAGQELTFGFDL